jgi:hypothetical protein
VKRGLVVAIALGSGLIGFLLGRISPAPDRAEPRTPPRREAVALPPDAEAAVQAAADRVGKRAGDQVADAPEAAPTSETPLAEVPGTVRPDGTIVGGASWAPYTRLMAVSFFLGRVDEFFADANLTDHQKQLLKAELEQRITDVMQAAADFTNGALDGDATYEKLADVVTKGRAAAAQVLDDRQMGKMQEFERGIGDFNRTNIVNNELTTLRKELGLDSEQERLVRPMIEERYRRVQERFGAPLPNFMFKPIRRQADKDIYDETGQAIREYLRPEQKAAFDAADAKAATAIFEYRSLLVPKPPG